MSHTSPKLASQSRLKSTSHSPTASASQSSLMSVSHSPHESVSPSSYESVSPSSHESVSPSSHESVSNSSPHLADAYSLLPNISCSNRVLVIGVCSAVIHRDKRTAIRKTWGQKFRLNSYEINIVFIIGMPTRGSKYRNIESIILNEGNKYQDILQISTVDRSDNLSAKSLAFFGWAREFCTNIEFLLKCDDDVFVNILQLYKLLSDIETNHNVIIGHVISNARPIKNKLHKWYISKENYSKYYYPKYISGSAYLIPFNVAQRVYEQSKATKTFQLEDVYLTGMLAKQCCNASLLHKEKFVIDGKSPSPCLLHNVVTYHPLNVGQVYQLWKDMQQTYHMHYCN